VRCWASRGLRSSLRSMIRWMKQWHPFDPDWCREVVIGEN
jgi:hypothetical protein